MCQPQEVEAIACDLFQAIGVSETKFNENTIRNIIDDNIIAIINRKKESRKNQILETNIRGLYLFCQIQVASRNQKAGAIF